MKKKIIFTTLLVIIGAVSFLYLSEAFNQNAAADNSLQNTLTEKSKKILKVWAVLKVVNGVVNVLQSAQIGGSFFVEASVNPLEFLAPLDNILDQVSDLMLLALGAIVMEKLLLSISGFIVFKLVIPVCVILFILTIWLQKDKTKLNRIIPVFFVVSITICAAAPASLTLSTIIEKQFFGNRVGMLVDSITNKGEDAESMQNEVTGLKKISKTIINFMANAKELGDALIDDLIDFLIIFFVTYLILPILTMLGIVCVVKYAVKLIF